MLLVVYIFQLCIYTEMQGRSKALMSSSGKNPHRYFGEKFLTADSSA